MRSQNVLRYMIYLIFFQTTVGNLNDLYNMLLFFFFFFQAEDGIRDDLVTGVQTCALPISLASRHRNAKANQPRSQQVVGSNLQIYFQQRNTNYFSYSSSVPYKRVDKKGDRKSVV